MCLAHIPKVAALLLCVVREGQKFQRSGSGGEERSGAKGHCGHHDVMYERGRKVLKKFDLSLKKTLPFILR